MFKQISRTGLIIISGVFAALVLIMWFLQPDEIWYYTLATVSLVVVLLWLGNQWIAHLLDKWLSWKKYGKWRLFTHMAVGILFSIGVLNLAYFLVKSLVTDFIPTTEQLIVANVYGIVVIVPIFSIYFSLHFLNHWQKSELEVERFQKDSMSSQLASLKNHLDPHFLFNNLNILSALIDKDAELSQEFLSRFAQVYRTMLLTKTEDLVTLREEMDFIQTYIYLIKTRFEENILFQIDMDDDAYDHMLPPLTLQMLIENAVKHNMITAGKPLRIRIYRDEKWLVIENNLNEKAEDLKTKSGTGLANIRARYSYYTDETVHIFREAERFVARLPLIEIEVL